MKFTGRAFAKCPHCGKELLPYVYDKIDSKHDPYITERIMKGIFFEHKCWQCGKIIKVKHNVLYSNLESNYIIWLATDKKFADECEESLNNLSH